MKPLRQCHTRNFNFYLKTVYNDLSHKKKLVDCQNTLDTAVAQLCLVQLSLEIHVLCFTSQHTQARHHRGYHNIDPEVALCVTAVIGLHLAPCQRLSVGVVRLKWWRAEPLKKERKAHVSIYSQTFAVVYNILIKVKNMLLTIDSLSTNAFTL